MTYRIYNTQDTVLNMRKAFNNLCKNIYVDLDYVKEVEYEEGRKDKVQNIPFIVDMIFYLIMSQYFKKIKIKFGAEVTDLRISVFTIRPSRMGKGQLIKIIEHVAKNLDLKTKRVSYMNQASLIGSINQSAIDYNTKFKLLKGHPRYIEPVMYGALKDTDILIFPEAKKLVKGTNEGETEFILSTLQEALDYPGVINKELKYTNHPISYESTVSIFSTTYYIEEIANLLLEQGFFQRNLIDKKNFKLDEVESIREKIINKYRQKTTRIDFAELAKDYAEIVKQEFNNKEKELEFTDEAVDGLLKFNKQYFTDIKQISGKELEILKSFSQTVIHMLTKIAGINCCLRNDTKVQAQDLIIGIDLFREYMKILTGQLNIEEKGNNKLENDKRLVVSHYKKYVIDNKNEPSKSELRDYLFKKNMGGNKAHKLIERLIEENYFKVINTREKNKQILKLNPDLNN